MVANLNITGGTIRLLVLFALLLLVGTGVRHQSKQNTILKTALVEHQHQTDSLQTVIQQLRQIRSANRITLTAYNPVEGQTDATPLITASGDSVTGQTMALSRDLLRRFTPDAEYDYGDYVWVLTRYRVTDTMNARYSHRADLLSYSLWAALQFGRRPGWIIQFEHPDGISG